jgi:hypothetical protein
MKRLIFLAILLLLPACSHSPLVMAKKYQTAMIQEPSFDNTLFLQMNYGERVAAETMKPKLAKVFRDKLKRELERRKVFDRVSTTGDIEKDCLLIRPEFSKLNAGDKGARLASIYLFRVPVMGHAVVEVEADVVDGETGETIGHFRDYKKAGYNFDDFDRIFYS